MPSAVLPVFAAIVLVVVTLAAVFVVGLRTKSPLVLRPLFAISRRYLNPRQLRRAGRPGAFASLIRHRGRRSGRSYETPVGVMALEDGFVIMLPYGSRTQWLRNVLAAGEATVVTEGATYHVDKPQVVSTEIVADRLSRSDQWSARVFAVTECLRLRRSDVSADAADLGQRMAA
jgi:deazaflavin-dependent oxidoreductase (nitroreductase family)